MTIHIQLPRTLEKKLRIFFFAYDSVEHGSVDVETFDGCFQLIDGGTWRVRSVCDGFDFDMQFTLRFVIYKEEEEEKIRIW